MKYTFSLATSIGALALLFSPVQTANANINMIAQESPGGVIITYSGSLRITELAATANFIFNTEPFGSVNASIARIEFAPSGGGGSDAMTEYWDVVSSRPSSFGTRSSIPSSFTGDYFYLGYDDLGVPDVYVNNQLINGSMTFAGATFASMGLIPTNSGIPFVWILENGEQVTLQIGTGSSNSAVKASLGKKIKKLKAKLKKAKRSGKKAKAKKLKKQIKDLKKKINAL